MKSNDISALHQMTLDELKVKLATIEKELQVAVMQLKVRKLANTSSVLHLKKDLARVKTVVSEKELLEK